MSELEILPIKRTSLDESNDEKDAAESSDQDRTSLLLDRKEMRTDRTTSTKEPDSISMEVMAASEGLPLFCIIAICLCMTACSFLLLYQFDVNESRNFTTAVSNTTELPIPKFESNHFCDHNDLLQLPLGLRILEFQINVIQNLVHASLVGSAAFVAVVRGDALWMFYVRNVAFFFIPVGLIYFFLDVRSVWIGESSVKDHALRLPLAVVSSVAAAVAFANYTRIFLRIRQMLHERAQRSFQSDSTLRYPMYLAETKTEVNLANLIYVCATVVQLLAWAYYATTLAQWISEQSFCSFSESQLGTSPERTLSDLEAFELAYSSGSHQALLIALLFLAATYPRDIASVGGALLTSMWRIIVAIGSLIRLLTRPEMDAPLMSWFNTTVEIMVMFPIVIASLLLAFRIIRRQATSQTFESLNENDKEDCDARQGKEIEVYQCASLSQIAVSSNYTVQQRHGARMIRNGTILLLFELTAECLVMLRQNQIGTSMTHEIYKWGMHICVMHIFCSIMCVETPFIFQKARKLLLAACPSGSLVALWQLSTLLRYTADIREDAFDQLVAGLLSIRALSGFIQTTGLLRLETLRAVKSETIDNRTAPPHSGACAALHSQRLKQLRLALLGIYIPTMVVYIFAFPLLGICYAPFVSKSVSRNDCISSLSKGISLAQNWPGMGLFFHYGMIIVIFAANGARKGKPSYKPSLCIASLFSAHVSILILVDLCWDALQTDVWSGLSLVDWTRRLLVVLWMVASALLWLSCERVLEVRLVPV